MTEHVGRTNLRQEGKSWRVEYIGSKTGRVKTSPAFSNRREAELHARAQLGASMD